MASILKRIGVNGTTYHVQIRRKRKLPRQVDSSKVEDLAVSVRLNERPATVRGKWLRPARVMLDKVAIACQWVR